MIVTRTLGGTCGKKYAFVMGQKLTSKKENQRVQTRESDASELNQKKAKRSHARVQRGGKAEKDRLSQPSKRKRRSGIIWGSPTGEDK